MWAGESFIDAYFITLLIIIPFTIDLIQNIGLAIMQAQNRYDFRAKVYCAMGILNLVLAIPLALKYGGIGCAFATGLAMFLGNGLIMNWYYVKVTGLDITRFWREIGKICAVVIVITILGNSIYNMLKISESKLIFGFSILVYSSIYLIVLYITVMNQDEKDKITSIIKRIGIIN